MEGRRVGGLNEWRCVGCRRILAKLKAGAGTIIEIKCKHCNEYNVKKF